MRVTTIPDQLSDIDGKATTDTSDARLEPLRMSTQWDFAGATNLDSDGDPILTYSYYDGDVAYMRSLQWKVPARPEIETPVTSHGAEMKLLLMRLF